MIINKKNDHKNILIKFVFWLDEKTDLLGKVERNRAAWLLRNFPINKWLTKDELVLDIGSGIGDIATELSENSSNKIFGFDIVDFRRKEILKKNSFYFFIASAYEIPVHNECFDVVLILVTLHHLIQPEVTIKEALRVLKPGGKIIILEDLIGPKGSYLRFITFLIDNIINLSVEGNPRTNKTESEWTHLFENKFKLKKVTQYSIKWGPLFKSLKMGLFYYQK